jgi:hypothetical protein
MQFLGVRRLAGRVGMAGVMIRMPDPSVAMMHVGLPFRIGGVNGPHAEYAFDAADDAADRTADDRSDGPRSIGANIGAVCDAVWNALRFRSEWAGE